MPRKKQYLDDGYSSDSASTSGSVDGTDLQRKRKRKGTKEDAIYGIFGSGSEGENERQGGAGRSVKAFDRKGRKVNFLKGQTFVPATNNGGQRTASIDQADSEESSVVSSDSDFDRDLSEAERIAKEPGNDVEMMETRNPYALGLTREAAEVKAQLDDPNGFRPASFMSSRGGIGSRRESNPDEVPRRVGLGSTSSAKPSDGLLSFSRALESGPVAPSFIKATLEAPPGLAENAVIDVAQLDHAGVPSAFGAAIPSTAFTQRQSRDSHAQSRLASFVTTPTTSIKFGGGMGGKFDPSKYLAQMGWTGGGLGRQGEGIVNPIEVKQRPERAGIAFGGIKEKTKQAKEEARRRGEEVSTDEDERDRRKKSERRRKIKSSNTIDKGAQAWTRSEKKPRKPKIDHKTYEELLEEHGHAAVASGGNTQILDAAGNEFSSISAALARHAVPSNESQNLVEIRHNLLLICEGNSKSLQMLAKEGASIVEKHKWLERDRQESQRRIAREEIEVKRLSGILEVVREIEALGRDSQAGKVQNLDSFDTLIRRVNADYREAIAEFRLDEAVIGAIVPLLRKQWSQWEPLEAPTATTDAFLRWKEILRIDSKLDVMTPYESLIWNLWMPPVRSALNNQWDPYESSSAIQFYQSWKPLLSAFLADNLSQQLIIPKISQAVNEWDHKKPLHRIIFPWMAVLDSQMNDVLAEAKRRIRSSLRSWKASQGVPGDLHLWREAKVFRSNEWNSMMLDQIIPKLSSHLDSHLIITRQSQNYKAMEVVLFWKSLVAPKILSKLLHAKLIPKWITTLHSWLKDPRANLEEIATWYEIWKSYFAKHGVLDIDCIRQALQVALQMMSQAMEMGSDRSHLPMPVVRAKDEALLKSSKTVMIPIRQDRDIEESASLSFRRVVEEAMMEADLLMQPLNRKEPRSGASLYRVSRNLDGKGGATIYMEEDVVFIEKRENGITSNYEPISIGEIVKQVGGG